MYIVFFAIICIIFSIIKAKKDKNKFNPISIFLILWGIIFIFSKLRFYTLFESTNKTYNYLIYGIISFVLGYYFMKLITRNKGIRLSWDGKSNKEYSINRNLCLFLIIFCIILIALKMIANRNILFSYGFNLAGIQKALQEEELESSSIMNAISFLIVNPLCLALMIVICSDCIKNKMDKKLFILVILLNIERIFLTGGRQAFIQFFFVLLIIMSFNGNQYLKKIGSKFILKIKTNFMLTIAVIMLILLSLSRTSQIVKTIYLDFAMQPYMFEYWSNFVDKNETLAYGMSSLSGFIYPIFYILKNLFHLINYIPTNLDNAYNMNLLTIDKWIYIGKELKANAYVSIFWYLYYDYRIIGIISGMFIMGMISYNKYIKATNNPNLINISKYCMIALCIFYSFGDMEFSKVNFALAYLYINFLIKNKEIDT